MTEQARREAIEKLEDLRKQGILSDDEYLKKVSELRQQNTSQNATKSANNGIPAIAWVTTIIFVIIFIVIVTQTEKYSGKNKTTATSTTSSNSSMTKDEQGGVLAYAQAYVKRKLVSPSTASFPWSFESYTFKKNGNRYTVSGYVDAQNNYGAKVRWKFETCFDIVYENGVDKGVEQYTIVYQQ